LLGEGSFGKVYLATWDSFVDTNVATKVIKFQAADEESAMKIRFEAAMSVGLQHPNIVRTFQYASRDDPGMPEWVEMWIVMEFCSLGTLHSLVDAGAFHLTADHHCPFLSKIIGTLAGIAAGLSYIHSRNVMHGDLSSKNVLLCDEGTGLIAKISDFGYARIIQHNQLLTKAMGTVAYMSPELFILEAKAQVSVKVDVYSFGALMYELFTGKHPWSELMAAQVVVQVAKGRRLELPPCDENDNAEGVYHSLFDKCTSREPEQRPSSRELVAMLALCSESMPRTM